MITYHKDDTCNFIWNRKVEKEEHPQVIQELIDLCNNYDPSVTKDLPYDEYYEDKEFIRKDGMPMIQRKKHFDVWLMTPDLDLVNALKLFVRNIGTANISMNDGKNYEVSLRIRNGETVYI
jgi:hypothetical protein